MEHSERKKRKKVILHPDRNLVALGMHRDQGNLLFQFLFQQRRLLATRRSHRTKKFTKPQLQVDISKSLPISVVNVQMLTYHVHANFQKFLNLIGEKFEQFYAFVNKLFVNKS